MIFIELVSMVSEEDEISLIVKCDYSARSEFRSLWEQRGKHAANAMTKHCVEVVEDELWVRVTWSCSMSNDTIS